MAADVIQRVVAGGNRVLFLAHREELLTQAQEKIQIVTGLESALEKAASTAEGSDCMVTVGSVQTLCRITRLHRFPKDYYQVIVVDEAHHVLSESYQVILDHFSEAYVMGITATAYRADRRQMGEYFDSLAYEYSLRDAVYDGFLSPIKAQMIPVDLDISRVKITAGDYNAGELGCALEPYLERIANEMVHYCQNRRTVVFLPLIAISQKFCQMLQDVGFRAAEVNGESENRKQILAAFEAGEYDVLCNSMLLTEGWDCPPVDCIVMLRPTKSRGLFAQAIGRGTRLYPGKDHLLILDFLWHTGQHDLCRPSSLLNVDELIAEKIDKKIEEGEDVDLVEAEEDAKRDVLAERERALARELELMRKMKRQLVNPLQYALSIAAEDLATYQPTFAWEMGPPSEKQLKFLERRGIYPNDVANAGFASRLIDRLKRRQEAGLSTPKQIRCLERYGFRQVGTWRFEDANSMIGRLAKNHWRLPYGFDAKSYRP